MACSKMTHTSKSGAMVQSLLSLLFLVVTAATCLSTDGLAHKNLLSEWLESWELDRFKQNEYLYVNGGNFLEFEDRLILDELPKADYSGGGVYFFGSSNLKQELKTWELPPAQRALIGNYGIGATNHTFQFQFIRYLVDYRNLLMAGGNKVHIVLGVSFTNALVGATAPSYFSGLWERHNLYTYSLLDGIHPARINPVERYIAMKRALWAGFLGRITRFLTSSLRRPITITDEIIDETVIRRFSGNFMPPDWQESVRSQTTELGRLIDYLQARGVGVTIVLVPYRKVLDKFPAAPAYRERVRAVCRKKSVPLVDLSRLLRKDDFFDLNHPNYRGLTKVNAALMKIADERLRNMGLLPQARSKGAEGSQKR